MDRLKPGAVIPLSSSYAGKRVLLTGHAGFKGSWLSLWLNRLGADVTGYATEPPTVPAMFELCDVAKYVRHNIGDVRDLDHLTRIVTATQPDVVFHLAAQPIVRLSYEQPLETLDTNVMGTAKVLEAVRKQNRPCAVVIVTSDKCYANNEWVWGYRETDPMGGADPYSMSKGAAELVVDSWRRSFFSASDCGIHVASGRAGNVIGGGDWSDGRIVKDCVAAFKGGNPVALRNPGATRPWQHVLEPLSGYLWLGARLMDSDGQQYAQGWNFGPNPESVCTVAELVDLCATAWGFTKSARTSVASSTKEAMSLSLSIEKAQHKLDWRPVWNLEQCVSATVDWYKTWAAGDNNLLEMSVVECFETVCGVT